MHILIADDHELAREALKARFALVYPDSTIDEVSDYSELLAYPQSPGKAKIVDLILLDLTMPDRPAGGVGSAVRATCKAFPAAAVVVLSGTYDGATVMECIRSGARGFLPKILRTKTLFAAVRLVLDGELYVPPSLLENLELATVPVAPSNESDAVDQSQKYSLSARETACLDFLVKGKSNKEIARELGIEEVTVKMHLRSGYRKIGASNRVDAVRIAIEHGLFR